MFFRILCSDLIPSLLVGFGASLHYRYLSELSSFDCAGLFVHKFIARALGKPVLVEAHLFFAGAGFLPTLCRVGP